MDLPPEIPLADLPGLRQQLLRHLAGEPAPRVVTDALQKASFGLVQLLVSAQLSARARGKRLDVTCPPGGALAALIAELGLDAAKAPGLRIEDDVWTGLTAA